MLVDNSINDCEPYILLWSGIHFLQLIPYLSRCTWDLNDLLAAINLRCDLNDLPAAMDFRQPEVANFRPAGRQFQTGGDFRQPEMVNFRPAGRQFQTAGCQYQQVMRGVQPCQQQEPAEVPFVYLLLLLRGHLPSLGFMGVSDRDKD